MTPTRKIRERTERRTRKIVRVGGWLRDRGWALALVTLGVLSLLAMKCVKEMMG